MTASLKERLASGAPVLGTFVKTPSPIVVEVLARTALDCLCLDAEHAPFDRAAIDGCLMAARASGMDVLVRTPTAAPADILNALDGGAAGVLLPHIRSAAEARAAVAASHYGPGGRGYAGSSRAADYTMRPIAEHLAASVARTSVVLQIEDPEAVAAIDAIAGVPGVDALFVGRVDLTVGMGATDVDDPRVLDAVETVCAAGRRHGRAVGMFLARPEDAPLWREKGASLFLLGSDHGFLLSGAADLVSRTNGGARRPEPDAGVRF